jgi:hypothetical protein
MIPKRLTKITSRIIRPGAQEPSEDYWVRATPAERMNAVWELTLLCLQWSPVRTMNQDFRDLLAEFNAHKVDFLVVGAHALAAHGHVRATEDLDLWIRPTRENAQKVIAVLVAFGALLHDLTVDDLSIPGLIFQIGVEPVRIASMRLGGTG